ncbi:MAG: hypothetical protein ABI885_03060 [Gammaproteobacteria bacterium]
MISRRTILQRGIAATSLPLVAGWLPLQTASARALEHTSIYKVLVDARFSAARAFGREAQWRGEAVHEFHGDVTSVWYEDLHPRWKKSPAAIAGLTAHGALFCLERLSWDVGMRVVHRAELPHEGRGPTHEPLYSWLIAPVPRRIA